MNTVVEPLTIEQARALHDACENNPLSLSFEECDNPVCIEVRKDEE